MVEVSRKDAFGHGFRLRVLAWVALVAWGVGCTTVGPLYSDRGADQLGPFPADPHEIVYRWIEDDFMAVTTIRSLDMTTPAPGVAKELFSDVPTYGWYSKVSFRALDGSGARTGTLYYAVLIKDGEVVASRKLVR